MESLKNLKYFNFERNKYFYGKLLNVEDFETEQRYMNDKRRLINRLVHGMGVVCGMNVIRVDEATISIEMGLALDFAGREIVIEKPVLKKLSTIDGFLNYSEEDEANNNLYLYVEYQEIEKEPVHSIAARGEANSKEEYNKYQEGYHLYLSDQEPDEDFITENLYKEIVTVYQENGIRIQQITPKYIESEKEFDITIQIEKRGQEKPISFSYRLEFDGVETGKRETAEISFLETDHQSASIYTITKRCRALPVKGVKGSIRVEEKSFSIHFGEKEIHPSVKAENSFFITEKKVKQEFLDQYYKNAMEEVVRNTNIQGICLARISVLKAGETYLIGTVESMPFHQFVYTNPLAQVMNELTLQEEEKAGYTYGLPSEKRDGTIREDIQRNWTACGEAVIQLGFGGLKGQQFFTEEIVHGLGLGVVYILLGEADDMGDTSSIIYGAQDIFEQRTRKVPLKMAAKIDVTKGTFQIGIECLEDTIEQQVKIHWIAIKDKREKQTIKEKRTLKIQPDMANVLVRENYYFEALLQGVSDSRVFWSVKEAEGGSIDENGMYTAPNQPGVYEIIAKSMDEENLTASTYVVVREK